MGLEYCETQLIHREEAMIEVRKDVNDGRVDGNSRLSGPCVRGDADEAEEAAKGAAKSLLVESEKCMHSLAMEEQDLRLLLVPVLVSRTRDGRVRRSAESKHEKKKEEEEEDDEGIAGCSPAEPLVMQVSRPPSPPLLPRFQPPVASERKRRHGILVIRATDDLLVTSAVGRKCSRVSWGRNETIEITREEEEDGVEDERISLFLLHSSDQRVWFASLGFLFLLASSLPFLSPLLHTAV